MLQEFSCFQPGLYHRQISVQLLICFGQAVATWTSIWSFSGDPKLPILRSCTLAQKVSRASRVVTTSLGTLSLEKQEQVHVVFFFLFKLKFLKSKASPTLPTDSKKMIGALRPLLYSTQTRKKKTIVECTKFVDGHHFDLTLFLFLSALFLFLQKNTKLSWNSVRSQIYGESWEK